MQRLTPNLHSAEGEPFLAQVLQRGPNRIDGVVEAEEAVVSVLEKPSIFVVFVFGFQKVLYFCSAIRSHLKATKRNLLVRRPNAVLTCLGSPKLKYADGFVGVFFRQFSTRSAAS